MIILMPWATLEDTGSNWLVHKPQQNIAIHEPYAELLGCTPGCKIGKTYVMNIGSTLL